ncbi:MAG: anthranilate phosphoribosyltransferase [Chromatiales bacterium 21-64-14]|nr:MAG: anthranilate phosphoribosyltransferase [Chromatiales bacterium 21-64-14]HQU15619.1 anthranilate phosphoribosyltransferase [Gammaproteobacteria bacterium]
MLAPNVLDPEAQDAVRSCIQKIATGPELSKDLSYDEARRVMRLILDDKIDPIQAAVFFIALRMKRETDEENQGVLQALIDVTGATVAPVDELVDVADPYDGYTRTLPASPFLPCVLAACGVPAVSHGAESVGPKYGVSHSAVLAAAGLQVNLSAAQAAQRLGDPAQGWAYVDQRLFCPPLHALTRLRNLIVKRPCLTTVEVLIGPLRARRRTHLMTGYVHKAYPRVYALLARHAGFDSAMIIRGVEGGVIPSLQQPAKVFSYRERGTEQQILVDPTTLGIVQPTRAVPLPQSVPAAGESGDGVALEFDRGAVATAAAAAGIEALHGHPGPTRDSLVYSAAICLTHIGRYASLPEAAATVRGALDSGAALARFQA